MKQCTKLRVCADVKQEEGELVKETKRPIVVMSKRGLENKAQV